MVKSSFVLQKKRFINESLCSQNNDSIKDENSFSLNGEQLKYGPEPFCIEQHRGHVTSRTGFLYIQGHREEKKKSGGKLGVCV